MEFKKILYPILLVLILISGLSLYVSGLLHEDSSTNITIVSTIQGAGIGSAGDLYGVVQKNGTTARYNFTIMLDDALNVNITTINITVPSNLSRFIPVNDSMYSIFDSFYTNDSTIFGVNGTDVNATVNTGENTAEIFFTNGTVSIQGIEVSVNLTSQVSDEAGGDIDLIPMNWSIRLNLSNDTDISFSRITYVDTLAPRIVDFNLSDGNNTITNVSYNYNTRALMSNNTLTATVVVSESNLRDIRMYYACTSNETNASVAGGYGNASMSTSDTASPYLYTATLANTDCIENNETNNNLTVIFDLNDRVGFKSNASFYTLDDAVETTAAYRFIINSTIPTVRIINITDAASSAGGDDTLVAGLGRLDGSSDFFATNTLLTINIEVAGQDLANESRLFYIVNSTAGTTSDEGFFDDGIQVNLINISGNVTDTEEGIVRYNGTIEKGRFNDTSTNTTINFLLMVNGSGNSYTYRYRGAFGIDGDIPVATTTAPVDTTIGVQNSIAYKCTGVDGTGSGVASCSLKFTKPDGTALTFTTCAEKTINGVDTGLAGTYTVDCKVTDDTGNTGSAAQKSFLVLHSAAGGGTGGSGSGGSTTTTTVDVDLTTAETGSVAGYKGNERTFTLGGAEHKISFTDVTETSATLTIESNPVVVTLNVGETKKVDLNSDGLDDLELTLNTIYGGKADVTILPIDEPVTPESEAAQQEAEDAASGTGADAGTEEESSSSAGKIIGWIIAVIVIIGLIAWFIARRKN